MSSWSLLAHAGTGSTWQAMVVVAAIVLALAFLAAATGLLGLDSADDLVLPLAGAAVVSSAAPLADTWLSDAVGWGVPLLATALTALLLGALTPLDVRFPAPLPMGSVALAAVTGLLLYPTLTMALHPPGEVLPSSDDGEVMIVSPEDGEHLEVGDIEVVVAVGGASLGPGDAPVGALPDDPEEAAGLAVGIEEIRDDGAPAQQERVNVEYRENCTIETPCTSVSFPLTVESGAYELTVDLTRGDGTPLAPFVRDEVTFTVE